MLEKEKSLHAVEGTSTKANKGYYMRKYNAKMKKRQEIMSWIYEGVRCLIMLVSMLLLCFAMILVGG